jgi:hypothetical protein
LKSKNGVELMQELNLLQNKETNSIHDLLSKKREMAIKGHFNLPKMRNPKHKPEHKNNISIVQENSDEESNSSIEPPSDTSALIPSTSMLSLTKQNLNRMTMKQQRSKF